MSKELRQSIRYNTRNSNWKMKFQLEEETYETPIEDVAEMGISISPPQTDSQEFNVGALLDQVYIVTEHRSYGPMQLRTKRVTFQLEVQKIHVVLVPTKGNSEAIIRQAYQDLHGAMLEKIEEPTDWVQIPARGNTNEQSRLQRLNFLREKTSQPLSGLEHCYLDPTDASTKIENFIGSVEMPVGIAGPLPFHGERVSGQVYAPFATNETSLVASAARGCKALALTDGVATRVVKNSIRLNPLIMFTETRGAIYFSRWLLDHRSELSEHLTTYYQEIDTVEIWPHGLGTKVHISINFLLKEGGTLSLVKQATWTFIQRCLDYMLPKDDVVIENFVIDSSFQGDTTAERAPLFADNGLQVVAEGMISDDVAQSVLKTSAESILSVYRYHQTNRNLPYQQEDDIEIYNTNSLCSMYSYSRISYHR